MNINYIDEIRKIERAIELIDESSPEKNLGVRSKLVAMLDNLKLVAAEMADYINNGIDENVVEMIKQGKNTCYKNGDYIGYLKNMGDLMRMERISSICRNQMPDEKAYFLREYSKYLKEQDKKDPKVL